MEQHASSLTNATNLILATHKDGTPVHGPAVLRATLAKVSLGLAQKGVQLPDEVVELVGEIAAEAGVMDGQPQVKVVALMELHLEKVMPEGAASFIDRAFEEADIIGPEPLLRFAAAILGLVKAGGVEKKRVDSATKAGPLARAVLGEVVPED
jgi:hypothetical protein